MEQVFIVMTHLPLVQALLQECTPYTDGRAKSKEQTKLP